LIGDLQDKVRDEVIDKFRNMEFNVLISTNVLARGIDVPEVDLVVNYDTPYISTVGWKNPDFANYIHRVGRTGRFGTDGLALTLCSDETDEDLVKEIEKHYETTITQINNLDELLTIYSTLRSSVSGNAV
jgi:ATP-dependent RNA helicase DDX19/DBP5